jgi:hypothetical protein
MSGKVDAAIARGGVGRPYAILKRDTDCFSSSAVRDSCRAEGARILLHECCKTHMTFEQNVDGTIDPAGFSADGADPYKVVAACLVCKHTWRIRGVTQITNLAGYPRAS